MAVQNKNYEADNRTGINHEGKQANEPVRRLTANSIIGDPVENRAGEKLGQIEDLMININTGMIEYAVVQFGAFLGIGGKLFAIPFSELWLNAERKSFLLDREKEDLRESPGFDRSHWPGTNDHTYFNDVDDYYKKFVPPFP